VNELIGNSLRFMIPAVYSTVTNSKLKNVSYQHKASIFKCNACKFPNVILKYQIQMQI